MLEDNTDAVLMIELRVESVLQSFVVHFTKEFSFTLLSVIPAGILQSPFFYSAEVPR